MRKKDEKNMVMKEVIDKLYKISREKKKGMYKAVAELLETPRRKEIAINLAKFEKLDYIKDDSILIVPGKILGTGKFSKKAVVYANAYSETAKMALGKNAKTMYDLCKDNIDYGKAIIIR